MRNIHVICIGKLKEDYLRQAQAEYEKRLSGYGRIHITELPEQRLPEHPSETEIERALQAEGSEIARRCKGYIVALCIEGEMLSSPKLAQKLSQVALQGFSDVTFLIGSSFGLAEAVKQKAHLRISMSPMTFPHQLARIMLLEQLYRACSINHNGKYHK